MVNVLMVLPTLHSLKCNISYGTLPVQIPSVNHTLKSCQKSTFRSCDKRDCKRVDKYSYFSKNQYFVTVVAKAYCAFFGPKGMKLLGQIILKVRMVADENQLTYFFYSQFLWLFNSAMLHV